MATETTVDMTANVSKPGLNDSSRVMHPTGNSENGYRNNSKQDSRCK